MKDSLDPKLENFMHNVAFLRKACGLSKREMAKRMQIGVGSLTKLENGILPPKLSPLVLLQIEQSFGLSPDDQFIRRLEDEQEMQQKS